MSNCRNRRYFLLYLMLILCVNLSFSQSKRPNKLSRENEKVWEKEVKLAKRTDHNKIKKTYSIGWLSGIWCEKETGQASIHFQIMGADKARRKIRTNYNKTGFEVIILCPENIDVYPRIDPDDKTIRVVMPNTKYHDIWWVSKSKLYRPEKKGLYTWRFSLERIYQISESEFQHYVKRTFSLEADLNFDYRKYVIEKSPTVDMQQMASEQSQKKYIKCTPR